MARRGARPRPTAAPERRPRAAADRQPATVTTPRWPLAAVIPVAAALAVYLPALRNGFVWDDPTVLLQTHAIHSLGDLLVPPPIIPKFYFRPLIFLSYLIDQALGGDAPFWFHLSVVLWHALATALVFVLGMQLFAGEWLIAAGGALLFAVFPTHVESVAWMVGRSDVIVCAFVLVTVLLYARRTPAETAWLGGAAYLAALLSKEMAVACLALVPALDALRDRRLYPRRYLPLILATGVYFVMRHHALGVSVGGMATGASLPVIGADVARAVGVYVARAVIPAPLCGYIPSVPGNPLYLVLGLAAPLSALAVCGLAWRGGTWQPMYLLLWFFATLAPSLIVIVRRSASAVIADRYLYVPTAGSCLLVAYALVRLAERRRLPPRWPAAAVAALTAVFAAQVIPYSRVWTDNYTFWADAAAKVPQDALPHRELAEALQQRGHLQDAERELQRALGARDDRDGLATTYNDLGNLYRRERRYDEADTALSNAIATAPNPGFYHNLGMTLMLKTEQEQQQGDRSGVLRDIARARKAFESALALGAAPGAAHAFPDWDTAKTHALLGQVLFSLGERAAAREHLEAALRQEPLGPIADVTRQYLQKLEP